MKIIFVIIIFCGLTFPSVRITLAALLEGTWKVKDASSVIKDGNAVNVFQNMSFVIGKYDMNEDKCSYTTDHQENKGTEVWPNSGTWKFNGQKGFRKVTDKDLLLRNDNV